MQTIKLRQSRTIISTLLLFSFLVLEEQGPARSVDDNESLTVTAQVSQQAPLCQGMQSAISFAPAIDSTGGASGEGIIFLELPNISDVIYIDFEIVDGYTENCDSVFGYVTFSESGFVDQANSLSVNFLEVGFRCDASQPLSPDIQGIYSCGEIGSLSSPLSLEMNVTADPDTAYSGYFGNTLSIDLYANP